MASNIYISNAESGLWVSNTRLHTLVEFAIEVGEGRGGDAHVDSLRNACTPNFFDFDLDKHFPTLESRKFWSCVFFEVSQLIFLRQLGNHETDRWQASCIADAQWIARALTHAVRQSEMAWSPWRVDQ